MIAVGRHDAAEVFRISSLPPDFYYLPNFITPEEEASILQKIPSHRWVNLTHRRLQAHPSTLTKNNTLLAAPLPSYLVTPIVERFKALGIFQQTPHKGPNHVLINEYKRGEGIMPHEDGSAYAPVVATVSLGAPICLEISRKPSSEDDEETARQEELGNDRKASSEEVQEVEKDKPTSQGRPNEAVNSSSEPSRSSYKLPTRILQEPRSLLITTGSAYADLLHGIAPIELDEGLHSGTVANWNLLAEPYVFEEAGGRNERATRVSLTYRDVLKVSSAASKVLGGIRKR